MVLNREPHLIGTEAMSGGLHIGAIGTQQLPSLKKTRLLFRRFELATYEDRIRIRSQLLRAQEEPSMPINDNVRSIRGLAQQDGEFEELLGRVANRFQREHQRYTRGKVQPKPALETQAESPEKNGFNSEAMIPFGLTTEHIYRAMADFTDFMRFIDIELSSQQMARFEDLLTTSNFSSMVGEFMSVTIPKYCRTVAKNNCHNGHPDILPAGIYPNDSIKDAGAHGIEIKASRYLKNWQAHPGENSWLMMFVFQSGRLNPRVTEQVGFKFLIVAGGPLVENGGPYAGRSLPDVPMITRSVAKVAAQKIMANWIYKCKELR